jgi:hypothetical protein
VEPTNAAAVLDPAAGETEIEQLRTRHHAMLAFRQFPGSRTSRGGL